MWNRLATLFISSARQAEAIRDAEFTINSNRALIGNLSSDQQVKSYEANRNGIFKAYGTIATYDQLRALKLLLEFEKALKINAQAKFWADADEPIQKALKPASPEAKETAYRYIFENAHKGQIAGFILAHAKNISPILTSPKNARNTDYIGTILSHAAPKTAEFLETFQPEFELIYAGGTDKLALTKKLLKACMPINGKDRAVTPPDYVQTMRREQIKILAARIVTLYFKDDNGYKQITNCLQELETLKASNTDLLDRVKSSQADKGKSSLYLYRLDIPPSNKSPSHLYIVASKPKGYGVPTDGGLLKTVLATTDIDMVAKSFSTLPYDAESKKVLQKLAEQYGATSPEIATPTYATKSSYKDFGYSATSLPLILHPSFAAVSQLTDGMNRVNSSHVQVSCPQYRDIQPLQHHQPREIQ